MAALSKKQKKVIAAIYNLRIVIAGIVAAWYLFSPIPARSWTIDENPPTPIEFMALVPRGVFDLVENSPAQMSSTPAPHEIARETFIASVSAYTAHHDQTDDTPDITANGERVHEGGVACPSRYEFGQRIRIGEKVYRCNDRMNVRYRDGDYFDIFMASKPAAIEFGRQDLRVEVLP